MLIVLVGPFVLAALVFLMARWILKRLCGRKVAAAIGVILGIAVAFVTLQLGVNRARLLSKAMCCQSSLHQFDLAIGAYRMETGMGPYPMSLTNLSPNDVSPMLFYCPGYEGGMARTVAEAGLTTTYIYIANPGSNNPAETPVILCPPLFHSGKGGNMLCVDHATRWIRGAAAFDEIMDRLYADTNLIIVVSEDLTRRSNGRYKSRPTHSL